MTEPMPRYHRPTFAGDFERVTVNLEVVLVEQLDRIAAKAKKPRSEVIREAVRRYLERA